MPNRKVISLKFALIALLALILLAFLVIWLKSVFQGHIILLSSFHLLRLEIHYYGLLLALAVLLAIVLSKKFLPTWLSDSLYDKLIIFLILSGFVGSRLYHVITESSYYFIQPLDILKVWNGGLSIYGAVIGGLVGLIIFAKYYSLSLSKVLELADSLVPGLALGQAIGRFGNLFNYELYGYPTDLKIGMYVPPEFRNVDYQNFNFFHPLFLYESVLLLLILLLTVWLLKLRRLPLGAVFFSYLFLYNIARFGLEFLRIDAVFIGQIRLNAVVSLIIAMIALTLFLYVYFRQHKT